MSRIALALSALLIATPAIGQPSLWSVSAFGGQATRIDDNVARAVVSPDGTHIAYIPHLDAEGRAWREVWRMSVDGTDRHRLLTVGTGDSVWDLAWAPDSLSTSPSLAGVTVRRSIRASSSSISTASPETR